MLAMAVLLITAGFVVYLVTKVDTCDEVDIGEWAYGYEEDREQRDDR